MDQPNYPTPAREMTPAERINSLHAELVDRSKALTDWAVRLHNSRNELSNTQAAFDEASAAYEEVVQRFRMYLVDMRLVEVAQPYDLSQKDAYSPSGR